MPYKEIISICSQSRKKTCKCGQNVECLNEEHRSTCSSDYALGVINTLIEAIPLCDIIEVYINIYLRLYTTIFHNSE